MKLSKHEKLLISATVLFILLAVFLSLTQQNVINEVKHAETEASEYLIDINTASSEELISLDGIGSSLASRIIEYRTENGSFKNINELCNVSGIGELTFKKIKDYIKV